MLATLNAYPCSFDTYRGRWFWINPAFAHVLHVMIYIYISSTHATYSQKRWRGGYRNLAFSRSTWEKKKLYKGERKKKKQPNMLWGVAVVLHDIKWSRTALHCAAHAQCVRVCVRWQCSPYSVTVQSERHSLRKSPRIREVSTCKVQFGTFNSILAERKPGGNSNTGIPRWPNSFLESITGVRATQLVIFRWWNETRSQEMSGMSTEGVGLLVCV